MNHPIILRVRSMIVTLLVLICASPAIQAATAFSKIVVFGDSLNDRGNMVAFTNGAFPAPPTYAYGRQTNGPVWVEYLASRIGMADKIVNYAVVGAMTKPTPQFPTGNVWSDTYSGLEGTDVFSQVLDYLGEANGVADPNALFILEGGANDFPRVADPGVIVVNLVQCLVALESHGAKHIMLVNLPDIGKTPRLILAEATGVYPPGTTAVVSAACSQLNQALANTVKAVSPADVAITVADIYGFMGTVTSSPSVYGFVDVQMPYIRTAMTTDPAQSLFWDDLHPTTRAHGIFADNALAQLVATYSPANGHAANPIRALPGFVRTPQP